MKTSEVLYGAADEIERRGWATGNCGMRVEGPVCLEGAIAAVLGVQTAIYPGPKVTPNDLDEGDQFYMYSDALRRSAAYKAMTAFVDCNPFDLWRWNDHAPSATEVVEALRAAAVIEAAKESADVREPVSS